MCELCVCVYFCLSSKYITQHKKKQFRIQQFFCWHVCWIEKRAYTYMKLKGHLYIIFLVKNKVIFNIFLLLERRKKVFGEISEMLLFISADWRGMSVSAFDWQQLAGCYTVENEGQSKRTCAVANMSWADSVLGCPEYHFWGFEASVRITHEHSKLQLWGTPKMRALACTRTAVVRFKGYITTVWFLRWQVYRHYLTISL